ncbi:MAG: hypothetical protein HQM01_14595 [Magnetococcales bacterium]|nr:hypothetical protein [Magnetococcales bacterium]
MTGDRLREHVAQGKCQCLCDQRKKFVVQEKGRSYRLENPHGQEVCQIRIDGCFLSAEEGKRCDYLFRVDAMRTAFFVELKGSDLLHAVRQIQDSWETLSRDLAGDVVNARIVVTRVNVPNIENNPELLDLRKKIAKTQGSLMHKAATITDTLAKI